jgi:hypothetical protein
MPAEPTPTTLTAERGASAKTHFPLDVKFPVYSVAWTDDKTVLLAGGGGSSRTGVKNRFVSATRAGSPRCMPHLRVLTPTPVFHSRRTRSISSSDNCPWSKNTSSRGKRMRR